MEHSYQYGQINDTFYKEILDIIETCSVKLEKDSDYKAEMS